MILDRWWRDKRRKIDMKYLWPSILDQSPDIDMAKGAFFAHCINDRAWNKDFTRKQLIEFVSELAGQNAVLG